MTDNLQMMASLDLLCQGPTQTNRPLHKFKKVDRLENAIQEFHQIFLQFLPIRLPHQMSRPQMKSLDSSCRKLATVSFLQAKEHFLFSKEIQLKDVEEFSKDNIFRVIGNTYRSEIPSLMSMQKLDHDPRLIAAQLLLAYKDPFMLKRVKPLLGYSSDEFLNAVAEALHFQDNTYLSSANEWALLLEREIDVHRKNEIRNGLSNLSVTALPPKAMQQNYFCTNVCQSDEIVQKNIQNQKDDLSQFAKKLGLELSDSYFFVDIRPVEVNREQTYTVLLYADADEILSDSEDS